MYKHTYTRIQNTKYNKHIISYIIQLYHTVIIDTPIADYFLECISSDDLNELNVEIIRNKLYKAYLEDFAQFCAELGNETGEKMTVCIHMYRYYILNELIVKVNVKCNVYPCSVLC